MSSASSWRRAISLATLVGVACGALQAATPKVERAAAVLPTSVREVRLLGPRAKAMPTGPASLRAARFSADRSRAELSRPGEMAAESEHDVSLEPWSLIAGVLGVMIFIARRRRTD